MGIRVLIKFIICASIPKVFAVSWAEQTFGIVRLKKRIKTNYK